MEQKVSAVADDVAMEWRRAGSVTGVAGLDLGVSRWFGSEYRRFRGVDK